MDEVKFVTVKYSEIKSKFVKLPVADDDTVALLVCQICENPAIALVNVNLGGYTHICDTCYREYANGYPSQLRDDAIWQQYEGDEPIDKEQWLSKISESKAPSSSNQKQRILKLIEDSDLTLDQRIALEQVLASVETNEVLIQTLYDNRILHKEEFSAAYAARERDIRANLERLYTDSDKFKFPLVGN